MRKYLLLGAAAVLVAVSWRRSRTARADRELWAQVTDEVPAETSVPQE